MLQYGRSKKYLLWTLEPRFDKHFTSQVSYPLLPNFHVMNLYTGIFTDNYFFVPRCEKLPALEKFLNFSNKKIVSLMTYQSGFKWKFFHGGIDLDLCNLRTKIALEGHHQGVLDIYGRGWSKKVKRGQSRGENWHEKKLMILSEYHFHLCFENTNWPYYCTEKIWDAIQGGCLPIYYAKGNNIYDEFTKNSFLDYCDFKNTKSLLDYVQQMEPIEFQERMNLCIQAFNRAVQYKQESKPYQKLLQKTLQKIQEIME